ncbi:hypothetical protein FH609_011605 [Streptomyces sp. 3MP-14]|uniref:Uncharacterized protein n=1 Tax=Streptomyces mimosae TaxID=2586635 RepID=A0A5N6AFU6_9ACTN|nr:MULTISPECIES: hypothetical protein [Streptomyces]KAB8167042.1 hypothetical protein FH607_009055 [Streptomyces mimosae]KAB8176983.1 hypothetical protein FH609_011605 [Streptomyces sp. 3MP-14]
MTTVAPQFKGADDVAHAQEQRDPTAPATEPTPQAGRPATPCTTYTWCTATGEHINHASDRTVLRAEAATWAPVVLDAQLIDPENEGDPVGVINGAEFMELDASGMRAWAGRLHAFANQITALAAQLDASRHRPAVKADAWTVTIEGGTPITGYLPAWAERTNTGEVPYVPQLAAADVDALTDVTHWTVMDGVALPHLEGEDGKPVRRELFAPSMVVTPHADDPAHRVPHIDIEVTGQLWARGLNPEQLAEFTGALRTQCDRLDQVHADLIDARADWQANTTLPPELADLGPEVTTIAAALTRADDPARALALFLDLFHKALPRTCRPASPEELRGITLADVVNTPLPELLERVGAVLGEIRLEDADFGGVLLDQGHRLVLAMPPGRPETERDAYARVLIGQHLGFDTSGLPVIFGRFTVGGQP